MGLDIYFHKAYKCATEENSDDLVNIGGEVYELESEYTYFRKVNFIVGFFRSLGYNDDMFICKREDVEELISRCKDVLDNVCDGPNLLPNVPGFFFGSKNYDEYYIDKVRQVKEELGSFLVDLEDKDEIAVYFWY